MTIQTPTRITIEVHPPEPGSTVPLVTVTSPQMTVAAEPREDVHTPAVYEPSPCACLDDDEDCAADHANE